MIKNRLTGNMQIPESEWKKDRERTEESFKAKSVAKRAAIGAAVGTIAGPAGMLAGGLWGALSQASSTKSTVEPSREECSYGARWNWETGNAALVKGFAEQYILENRNSLTAQKASSRTPRKLAKVKQQDYWFMTDNQGFPMGESEVIIFGIGDQGLSYLFEDVSNKKQVFVSWQYFVNRPIFAGQRWSLLEEHEMPADYELQETDGCYVGDYMIYAGGLEATKCMIQMLLDLQKYLRLKCTILLG